MARLAYLLDLEVLAELTRPTGNRRVFTLFQQRQTTCAFSAPSLYGLLHGIGTLGEGPRKQQLLTFAQELQNSNLPVLPFDREAAVWLAREAPRQARRSKAWSMAEGQVAAIAATRDLILVSRRPLTYAGAKGLALEDWFGV